MRRRTGTMAAAMIAIAGSSGAWWAAGCSDCALSQTCAPEGATSGGGGTPAECIPLQDRSAAVEDGCGVFVSSSRGADGGAGTKGAPIRTLSEGIAVAQQHGTPRVYACGELFEEAVTVPGGVTIFGGLDCAMGWLWDSTLRAQVTAGEGEVPLRVSGGMGVARLEDVHAIAKDVDQGNVALRGVSSIAAIADGVEVEMARCTLEAGRGAPGAEGEAIAGTGSAGEIGNAGADACTAEFVLPGGSKVNDCGTPMDDTDDSIGGAGGLGQASNGGDGSDGSPLGTMNGGAGEQATACTPGTKGDDGAVGTPGDGATGVGTISTAGYTGTSGGDGGKGATAQGGGGGGAAKGGTGAGKCMMATSAGGASGGSGGSGGCGGVGGKGGGPGGSSIALVSVDAMVTLTETTLKTTGGGTGGPGGAGQSGGAGGDGAAGGTKGAATALLDGCAGGPGGIGGAGGLGGGGLGGHSIGVAYVGQQPGIEAVTYELGSAGLGGDGADPTHNGADGVKAEMKSFP